MIGKLGSHDAIAHTGEALFRQDSQAMQKARLTETNSTEIFNNLHYIRHE